MIVQAFHRQHLHIKHLRYLTLPLQGVHINVMTACDAGLCDAVEITLQAIVRAEGKQANGNVNVSGIFLLYEE